MTEETGNSDLEEEFVSTATESVDEADADTDELNQDEDGTGEEADNPEDDLEEVERDGKKYRVSKALKDELLMRADYTRKTMEHAEFTKAETARLASEAEAFKALREDHVRVHTLQQTLEQYKAVDWNTAFAQDPDTARVAYDQYRVLQDQHQEAVKDLSAKEQARLQSAREAADNALKQADEVLAREVKGWSPELVSSIADYAGKEFGISRDELRDSLITADGKPDTRTMKVLARLHAAESELKTLKGTKTAVQRHETAQQVQPAAKVKGNFAPAGLHDNLPTDEWVRRRNAQLAKKRA